MDKRKAVGWGGQRLSSSKEDPNWLYAEHKGELGFRKSVWDILHDKKIRSGRIALGVRRSSCRWKKERRSDLFSFTLANIGLRLHNMPFRLALTGFILSRIKPVPVAKWKEFNGYAYLKVIICVSVFSFKLFLRLKRQWKWSVEDYFPAAHSYWI